MDTLSALLCTCGSGLPADRCCAQDQAAIAPALTCPEPDAQSLREAIEIFNKGDRAIPTERCLRLLQEKPGLVVALHILADIRKIEGVYKAELALRRRVVQLAPRDLPQLVRFVTALLERGDRNEALSFARRAVWMWPDDVRAHWILALAFVHLHFIADAEYHFDLALSKSEKPSPDLLLTYAEHLHVQGRIGKAREMIARAEAAEGVTLRSIVDSAMVELLAGNLDAAEAYAARAVQDWPNRPGHSLVRAMIADRRHDYAGALEIIDRYDAGPMPVPMLLLRGRVLGALGRIDESFADMRAGKALELQDVEQAYRPDLAERQARRVRSRLTPLIMDRLPRAPVRDDAMQPLFITGFPRSGTTMLEQSLSMHPCVTAGGELRATFEVAQKLSGVLGSQMPYPEALAELLVSDRRHGMMIMRDDFLNNAMPHIIPKQGAAWFTDKSLLQEQYIPLRFLMFPASPTIHIVRHPLDSVLSVFSHQFSVAGGYSATLEGAALTYKIGIETAEQWRLTLPQIRYLRVRHEDILADQEGEMRRILAFIGQPYDPAVLDFHENTRVAATLSVSQVREKINTKGKYRYKRYLRHLEPIIPILEPVITLLGYTVEGE